MKKLLIIYLAISFIACRGEKKKSVEIISQFDQQDALFKSLATIANGVLTGNEFKDSLAFLVLPLEASCPSCRNKTIDSILKYQQNLARNHYIILSGKVGRKYMRSYFRERKGDLPDMPGQLIIDSTNQADQHKLYKNNPAIYYAFNQKVYKKVLALPLTVKQDLHEYFSGRRNDE